MGLISAKEACDKLRIKSSTICVSGRYKDFYIKSEAGKRNAKFALDEFLRYEDEQINIVEKTKLFTEYLNAEEGVIYEKIGEIGKTSFQTISQCTYGYEAALRILAGIKEICPLYLKRFNEYYGFDEHWSELKVYSITVKDGELYRINGVDFEAKSHLEAILKWKKKEGLT